MANRNVKIFQTKVTALYAPKAAAIAVTRKPDASQRIFCVMESKTVWTAQMSLTVVGVAIVFVIFSTTNKEGCKTIFTKYCFPESNLFSLL